MVLQWLLNGHQTRHRIFTIRKAFCAGLLGSVTFSLGQRFRIPRIPKFTEQFRAWPLNGTGWPVNGTFCILYFNSNFILNFSKK